MSDRHNNFAAAMDIRRREYEDAGSGKMTNEQMLRVDIDPAKHGPQGTERHGGRHTISEKRVTGDIEAQPVHSTGMKVNRTTAPRIGAAHVVTYEGMHEQTPAQYLTETDEIVSRHPALGGYQSTKGASDIAYRDPHTYRERER